MENVYEGSIIISMLTSSGTRHNSSILFAAAVPTVTPTPVPTIPAGYIVTYVRTFDPLTNSDIHGTDISMYDVEAAVVLGSPANPLDFVAGDYNELNLATPTEFASRFDFTSSGAGSDVNFTLNAAGIAAINTNTTPFTFYVLDGDELDNSFSGIWSASTTRMLRTYGVSHATQENRPYMDIVFTPGGAGDPPVASFTTSKTFVRIPQPITFTDTSTETPDEWLWDFGDGTTSTDQNPVHRYTKRGKWNVTLTATNDAGSDESDTTTVRVTGYETYT